MQSLPKFPNRLLAITATLLLVLAACSSSESSDGQQNTDGQPADSVNGGAQTQPETTTTVPSGPTTTFLPPLDGPFATDGGAIFDGDVEVIVDASAADSLPSQLANLTWPTDWTRRTVEDLDEFLAGLGGSDPRDGIQPIDGPVFESVALAGQWLSPREPGALVQFNDEVRFYPLSMLTRHEVVNDAFGDIPVAVTFCPLCNTALTFDRRINGETLRFGVSGLLRKSDLVMWDEGTTSLWQQITGEGVVGEFAGAQLEIIPTSVVSFQQFAENFPDGKSLAGESGFGRDSYGRNPYAGYSSLSSPFLFDGDIDDRFEALSRVVGVETDDEIRAYPFGLIADVKVVNDVIGSTPVVIFWGGDTADALDGQLIASSQTIGTAVAYNPTVDGEQLTFAAGPSDETFVDDQTGTTWTVLGVATDGELAGSRLEVLTHRNEFWFAWQAFFGVDNVYEG